MNIVSVRRAFLLWLALFAVSATTAGLPATPGSDLSEPEAHILLVTESIVSDADLDLRDEYGARSWRGFYDGELVPLAGPRDGRLLEPAGIAFPLLIAPAYALGGALAVQLFLAALAALGFVLAAALARRLVPDPWATGAAIVGALGAPALIAATMLSPEAPAATMVAGAAVLALRVRDSQRTAAAFGGATLVALLPWMGVRFGVPAAVIAFALARWMRRQGPSRFAALEVMLLSAVVYVTVNERLFGGPTPDAVLAAPGGSGADGVIDHLARAPRLLGLWIDRDAGLLRWAPFFALAFVALGLAWRSHRERLSLALPGQRDVELSATFLGAVCAAAVLAAAFGAPVLGAPWFAGRELVAVLPCAAALSAWGLRRRPRTGAALALLTVVASLWLALALRVDDDAGLAPARGPLPWLGAEDALPRLR